MSLYLVISIVLFLCALKYDFHNKNTKKKKFVFVVACILITLLMCLRKYSVGVDTNEYYTMYNSYVVNGWNIGWSRYEYGFSYLVVILTKISTNPQTLIIVSSLFINVIVFRFIYKNTNYPFFIINLYLLLNYWFLNMNVMRQAMAVAIVLLGYEKLKKDKLVSFYIFVFLACMFHKISVVALVFPIFFHVRLSKIFYIELIVISLLVFVFGNNIYSLGLQILGKYDSYIDSKFSNSNYFGSLFNLLIASSSIVLYFITIKRSLPEKVLLSRNASNDHFLLWMAIVLIVSFVLSVKVILFNRITIFLYPFHLLIIDQVFTKWRQSDKKHIIFIVTIIALINFIVIYTFRPEWHGCNDYRFFWQ